MGQQFEVRTITPSIGGEVSGLDLSKPLSDADFDTLHAAFLDRKVLFFRNQNMTLDQQKAFGRRFGELHIHPSARPYREDGVDHAEILFIHADENTTRTAGDTWHSDVSCDPEPPMASILRLVEIPPSGGDTLFASMSAAYDALSEPMKLYLGALTATHDGAPNYKDRAKRRDNVIDEKQYPSNIHPIIRTHPETGQKAIYVNEAFTTQINDIPKKEGAAVLRFLFDHIANAAFQCRFQWSENAIAMWDNRCTLHHAMWDYFPSTRSGFRVTVKGDKPF
ncbi:MAG: TauD/TfdA family dioxygenase [Alphaproteobacteria bacterium]|nr:TauD/TfdA family dioxygenase [Alphaproteobacteria bacterium]